MILAILQARMSSNRLPGKVLKPLLGKPMMFRQIERIKTARRIDKIVVATSVESSDDAIASACEQFQQPCFRGDLDNVLSRFYQCAKPYHPSHVVRLTADCPLIDPGVIDKVIERHLDGGFDYTTNAFPRTYPDGLDVEVMTMNTLQLMAQQATAQDQLEHVTKYIRDHAEQFAMAEVCCEQDLSQQRWTVDNPEDFALVEAIYSRLYPTDPAFDYHQVMALYQQQPALFCVNQHLVQ